MAKLDLTLYNVTTIEATGTVAATTYDKILVATERDSATVSFSVGTGTNLFQMDLIDLSFQKKMYQPTEVIATIQIGMNAGEERLWLPVPKEALENAFKNRKVSLKSGDDTIGDDYFVHEVLLEYREISIIMTLKIYSLDKMLTLEKTCRTFVSKRLGEDILDKEIVNYKKPYDTGNAVQSDISHMKVLRYIDELVTVNNTGSLSPIIGAYLSYAEHIHPYLVQYNESFYDLLARTANRWGEFLYYEDGKLRLGYPVMTAKPIGTYRSLHYYDLDKGDMKATKDNAYDYVGSDETSFGNNLLKESPNEISGTLFYPNGKGEKVAMNYMASIFKNDKNIPTFLVNKLFDDSFDVAYKAISAGRSNELFNDKYFPTKRKNETDENFEKRKQGAVEQYGIHNFGTAEEPDEKNAFNHFTELHSEFDSSKYATILTKEQAVSKNAVCIDFNTTYPALKLGNIIKVNGKEYIVVEVSTRKETTIEYQIVKDTNNHDVVKANPKSSLVFQVKATSKNMVKDYVQALNADGTLKLNDKNEPVMEYRCVDTLFYPTVLPSGHVRYSDPQIATVTDAADPTGCNRVRVKFSWEKIETKDKKVEETTKKTSSPWLTFTTNASGAPAVGLHYEGDKLLIGFVGGNIERPYVLGGLATKGSDADVVQTTPGGHTLKLNDDSTGVIKFLNGMFLPGWKTLSSFVPQMGEIDCSNVKDNLALGGGFELSDSYGVYKISGSTDRRNITVASPWGDVSINAFTGITISAPNGDISIKGKNVKIEAGNNLELTSGTNVKYKLFGGNPRGFGEDVAAAVVKKIGEMAVSLVTVDLSLVRSFIEIAIRPAEGKLLVKSNRYLMLESGKGSCDYPVLDYQDYDKKQSIIKGYFDRKNDEASVANLRHVVQVVIAKINEIADSVDKGYREAYHECYKKYNAFIGVVKEVTPPAYDPMSVYYDGASSNTTTTTTTEPDPVINLNPNPNPKFVKEYDELVNVFWANPPYADIKADDLVLLDLKKVNNKDLLDNIGKVTVAANALRKAICDFLTFRTSGIKGDVNAKLSTLSNIVPKKYKGTLASTIVDNMDEFVYGAPVTDDLKHFARKLDDQDAFKEDRKVLKRKVAVLMLDEMGFKDEWRKKVTDPNWVPDPKNPLPFPPKVLEVKRDLSRDALLNDAKWNLYVDSFEAVPKSSTKRNKAAEELMKLGDGWINQFTQFAKLAENKSWGDPGNGSILFSYNGNVYDLKKDVREVAVIHRSLDESNPVANRTLNGVNGVKNILKDLK